ncbi:hypothetical protein TruAng_011319 [Truncatella angustata]|nr:hypothetical protein TruAng_011319 [Truncatella angustata]
MAVSQSAFRAQTPTSNSAHAIAPVVAQLDARNGTIYGTQGQATFMPQNQALSVIDQSSHHGTVIKAGDFFPGTRLVSHLPLGPEDAPSAADRDIRQRFRNLVNEVNDLDRLYPDRDSAEQHRWRDKVNKLNRQIGHLERTIPQRLARDGNSPVFRELMPGFPRLWKYLDPSLRRNLEQQARQPLPCTRRIEGPATVKEEEDNKASVMASVARDRPLGRSAPRPGVRSSAFVKQEADQPRASQFGNHRAAPSFSGVPMAYEELEIKAEAELSDSDDCVIVGERQVRGRVHNRPPRSQRPPTRGARQQMPAVVKPKPTIPTRSLRNREVPLTVRCSRSPRFRSQAYRERSPRRDAIIEELSDSE